MNLRFDISLAEVGVWLAVFWEDFFHFPPTCPTIWDKLRVSLPKISNWQQTTDTDYADKQISRLDESGVPRVYAHVWADACTGIEPSGVRHACALSNVASDPLRWTGGVLRRGGRWRFSPRTPPKGGSAGGDDEPIASFRLVKLGYIKNL